MLKLLRPYRGATALLLLFALIANAGSLLLPKIIGRIIDGAGHAHLEKWPFIWLFTVSLLVFLVSYVQNLFQTYVSEKVARDLRTQLATKIATKDYSYVERENPAKLLTNFTADVDGIKMFVSQALVSIVSSAIMIIGTAVLLVTIDWKLALIVVSVTGSIALSFYVVMKKVKTYFKVSREAIDSMNKVINESILGAFLIRVLNAQQLEYHKFLQVNIQSRDISLSILRLFAWLIPIIVFTANIAGLLILVYGGHLVITARMSIGDLAAFNSYLALLIFPIIVIGFMSNVIAQASVSFTRIQSVLASGDTAAAGTKEVVLSGKISVRNAALIYGGKTVLRNINMEIRPGQKVAIVGPTAAGKTQLLNLIFGLVSPCSGGIFFDDIPLEEISPNAFYRQAGIVFQDSILFNLSLQDNIAFDLRATPETLRKAIKTAELTGFIESLPLGLQTEVSERGISLSGGQKQRIMLARTLAIEPRILLLDDFTARVDHATESRILSNLERNYPGITLVSVTQKLDAIKDYDQILLMMEGEVLAQGTHSELLDSSPEYLQMYNAQKSTNAYEL